MLSSCLSPPSEIYVSAPPTLPASAESALIEREIAGQLFWITEGREILKGAGTQVMIYDAAYLTSARKIITDYSNQQQMFDTANVSYGGAPGRIMRAKRRLRDHMDDSWRTLSKPVATVITDADGKFEFRGRLPATIGVYCLGGKNTFGDLERFRWAVTEDEINDPQRIILSNANRLP
jgi:hypothetical protein